MVSPEDVEDEMPPSQDIISEVKATLDRLDQSSIDVLTFSGTGEPTLNLKIGSLVSDLKRIPADIPIVLLTNASLLPRDDVRKGVKQLDIVTAKIDAGDEETFKWINHSAKGSFKLHEIVAGINRVGRNSSMLALEVMLLRGPKGLTNVEGPPRKALIETILDANPGLVQIYTPWRPTAAPNVTQVSNKILREFGRELESHLGSEKLWIYGVHDARGKAVVWKTHQAIEKELLTLLHRRPCRITDVSLSLGIMPAIAISAIEKLCGTGAVIERRVGNDLFYEAVDRFGSE